LKLFRAGDSSTAGAADLLPSLIARHSIIPSAGVVTSGDHAPPHQHLKPDIIPTMPDIAPARPPTVLSYANPSAAQPSNGRLQLEDTSTGIRVSDPKQQTTIPPKVVRWIGIFLLIAGTITAVALFSTQGHLIMGNTDGGIAAAVIGGILAAVPTSREPERRCVFVENGQIYHMRGNRKWRPRGRCLISRADFDLSTGQPTHKLLVRHWLRGTVILFSHLCRDEAIWARA
jgi:hypothetical protein